MQALVDPTPVDLSGKSVSVQMWERIIRECQGAELRVFFSPVNQELLGPWLANPGYQENLKRLDLLSSERDP